MATNPFSGIITPELKTLFTNMIDALLEDGSLVVPCRLIFGDTKWTDCPNCKFNSVTGRSANIYEPGGPIPFNQGVCPYCGGLGRTPTADTTSSVNYIVLWDYKSWFNWNGSNEGSRSPKGLLQTMSAISTITDIKKAKEIVINTDIEKYTTHRFTRDGEPNPCGFGSSAYIFTMWKKAGA